MSTLNMALLSIILTVADIGANTYHDDTQLTLADS